jgi:hypothetical protein
LSSRALQVVVAIVDAGSFAGAARRLGLAQPSISAHVQGLERETGARLFERASGQRVEVSYHASVHASFTEVDIEKAWDEATGKDVKLSKPETEDYANFIAEHHLNWQ